MAKISKNKCPTWAWIVIIILAILVLLLFNNSRISSPSKTCKIIDVPYQVNEEYQVPMKYEVLSATKTNKYYNGFVERVHSEIIVKNVDSETGLFSVSQTFTPPSGDAQTFTSTHYIMSGETLNFIEEYGADAGTDFNVNYSIDTSSRTLTRTVTKYKQEEQCN